MVVRYGPRRLNSLASATRAGTLLTGAVQKAWISSIDAPLENAGLETFQSSVDLPSFNS